MARSFSWHTHGCLQSSGPGILNRGHQTVELAGSGRFGRFSTVSRLLHQSQRFPGGPRVPTPARRRAGLAPAPQAAHVAFATGEAPLRAVYSHCLHILGIRLTDPNVDPYRFALGAFQATGPARQPTSSLEDDAYRRVRPHRALSGLETHRTKSCTRGFDQSSRLPTAFGHQTGKTASTSLGQGKSRVRMKAGAAKPFCRLSLPPMSCSGPPVRWPGQL